MRGAHAGLALGLGILDRRRRPELAQKRGRSVVGRRADIVARVRKVALADAARRRPVIDPARQIAAEEHDGGDHHQREHVVLQNSEVAVDAVAGQADLYCVCRRSTEQED